MIPVTADSIRLFLHVMAATVWVGGQLVLLGLLPVLRSVGNDAPKLAAKKFNQLAWAAFVVLIITGIWSLLAENPSDKGSSWNATFGVKMLMVAATAIAALIHAAGTSKPALAIGGAVSLLAAVVAVFLGIQLTIGG